MRKKQKTKTGRGAGGVEAKGRLGEQQKHIPEANILLTCAGPGVSIYYEGPHIISKDLKVINQAKNVFYSHSLMSTPSKLPGRQSLRFLDFLELLYSAVLQIRLLPHQKTL